MSHRAAIYNLHVYEKGKPQSLVPLGNIDGEGTYLGDFLKSMFDDTFMAVNEDTEVAVECLEARLDGEDLRMVFNRGESGLAGDVMDADGQFRMRVNPTDTQLVRCGGLLRLPKDQDHGWWAAHVYSNRSVKGLVETEMQKRFRTKFKDLMLEVTPVVLSAALHQALNNDGLQGVKLVKYDRSADITYGDQWLESGVGAKIEVRYSALGKARLIADQAKKALGGSKVALDKIMGFQGLKFDEAKLEVELDNGRMRTYSLSNPEGGHPLPIELDPDLTKGEPTDEGIWNELGEAVAEMQ